MPESSREHGIIRVVDMASANVGSGVEPPAPPEVRRRSVGASALAVFVVVVIRGYALGWGWTGFRGNKL